MKTNPERVFVFRLARELGMSVSRLGSEMDAREIAEWIAYFNYEAEEEARKAEAKEASRKAALSKQIQVEMKGYKPRGNKGR